MPSYRLPATTDANSTDGDRPLVVNCKATSRKRLFREKICQEPGKRDAYKIPSLPGSRPPPNRYCYFLRQKRAITMVWKKCIKNIKWSLGSRGQSSGKPRMGKRGEARLRCLAEPFWNGEVLGNTEKQHLDPFVRWESSITKISALRKAEGGRAREIFSVLFIKTVPNSSPHNPQVPNPKKL
ncbi:hypothetical protein TNIN_182721 [Trichonephila inaurata madagascariensis]|uniref:Uncharacterized protein n=1 Tax=Trichonephila inaurata madagascariensis TaxID=2747483 RepID=A0A8X7BNY5_9ARAC|nr:hypothetical protein TNIN_182721 [Trichonephila inaurata madagascariensis]